MTEELTAEAGLEAVPTPAGFNHTMVAGDFYFTPLKAGDRLMPNYHLSYARITSGVRSPRLNREGIPALQRAVEEGVDFDAVCEAGLLYTPGASANPFLHRSPAAEYSMLLKEGYRCAPAPSESGQRVWVVECIFKPGEKVWVKQGDSLTGSDDDVPGLERQEMTVERVEAGRVYVFWLDAQRVAYTADYAPGELEHVPAAPAEETAEAGKEEA